jgi:GT2 family glycosyltransferase
MDVSFIIVNYNTAYWVRICLDSIIRYTKDISYEIILVDNASQDRSIDAVPAEYSNLSLHYLPLTRNNGFGAGNNAALPIARGTYLFLLNPDTRLTSDAAGFFFKYMEVEERRHVAGVGADLRNAEGNAGQSFGNFPSFFSVFSALGPRWLYNAYYKRYLSQGATNWDDKIKEVDYISGAAMFLRRSVVDQIGLFDEDFFLFFEETEFAYRLRKAGYVLQLLPEVKIIHIEGTSYASDQPKTFHEASFKIFEKSRQLFYRKTRGAIFAKCMKPLDIAHMMLRTIAGRESGTIMTKAKIIWEA